MEHRWGRRIPIRVRVRLVSESCDSLEGQTDNISISGAFVRTSRPVPWTRIEVEVALAGGPGREPERIAAHVVRRASDGVGIEWHELAPRPVRALLSEASVATYPVRLILPRDIRPGLPLDARRMDLEQAIPSRCASAGTPLGS